MHSKREWIRVTRKSINEEVTRDFLLVKETVIRKAISGSEV